MSKEICENCGSDPKGITMWEGMHGWNCPYCNHYNELNED